MYILFIIMIIISSSIIVIIITPRGFGIPGLVRVRWVSRRLQIGSQHLAVHLRPLASLAIPSFEWPAVDYDLD